MSKKDKKKPEEPNADSWKFSEQICCDANLKGIKPDRMWNNPRIYKNLKFKCEINFIDRNAVIQMRERLIELIKMQKKERKNKR